LSFDELHTCGRGRGRGVDGRLEQLKPISPAASCAVRRDDLRVPEAHRKGRRARAALSSRSYVGEPSRRGDDGILRGLKERLRSPPRRRIRTGLGRAATLGDRYTSTVPPDKARPVDEARLTPRIERTDADRDRHGERRIRPAGERARGPRRIRQPSKRVFARFEKETADCGEDRLGLKGALAAEKEATRRSALKEQTAGRPIDEATHGETSARRPSCATGTLAGAREQLSG